ncbi:hypothetical protein PP175_10480 [Aneurinibacillus sp. Ricciae_BoGa-3]|uniref:hypothetical protein n=1 Tax=Aneurinibacillus sp. Ricciae_BoGa-3 TaxID=3022697 RepID=UPI0023418345|nr:hypothetical protein [Aneurinibacillus sp. Ricciae_BoGa-3]WCK56296.1 hypothetical protein PP175_10480 [Aneurinibacillus sp. Ricciae_BoGa-3]
MIHEELSRQISDMQKDLKRTFHPAFDLAKKEVLDFSFSFKKMNRVAELGGVGEIDCAYGLYAMEKYNPNEMIMVDVQWPNSAKRLCDKHKEISTMQANFGSPEMPERIGHVDTIILFDVLLHQVAPDWDQILEMYAPFTRSFIICNPQFTPSSSTVRLLDLGKEEYLKNVPHEPTHPSYVQLFSHMYEEIVPGRIWRDAPNVWQWGITNNDLIRTMDRLGFQLDFLKNYGQWHSLSNFEHYSYFFYKKD